MPTDARILVTRDGGFAGPVTLAVSAEYLELLDDHGFLPEPTATVGETDHVELTFDPPRGDTLRILLSGRITPDALRGRSGVVAVLEDGAPTVSVEIRTAVLP